MAVSANNAAFTTVRGLGDGVSQDVKYWNQDAANKRQEARIDDQIAYRKQQDTNKANLDLYDKHIKSNVPWDTGSKSENEVVAKGLQMITEQYGPLITTMQQNPPGSEKYLKALLKMDGLNSWAEQTKLVTDKIKGRHENIIKLASEGKIKKNAAYDNYLKAFDNGFATFELGADEQGKMFIAYKDLDKDGVNDLIGVETFDEVSKGQSLFKFDANYDANANAKAIAGEVGTFKKQTDSNFTKVETSGFDTGRLQTRVSEHLFDANGALTAEAKSYMQDLNYEDTPANREKIAESFTAKVNSFNKTTDLTTVDNSGMTGRRNSNRADRDSKAKNASIGEGVTPTESVWGSNYKNIDTSKVKSIPVNGIVLEAVRDGDETLSNVSVQNYTYNKNGQMILDVVVPKTKSITKQDFTELESKAESGDEDAIFQLELAIMTGNGGYKITIPGQNERRSIVVPKEDESRVSAPFGGIEAAKKAAKKDGKVESEEERLARMLTEIEGN
jgi:hypothetical protein